MLVVLQRNDTEKFPIIELYTCSSINKQYVEGVPKTKGLLDKCS